MLMNDVVASPSNGWKLTAENFSHSILRFRDRQAGVGLVFDPEDQNFKYNAYCMEAVLLTELFSQEFDFLDDALALVNDEFGQWELFDMSKKSGCGSCVAKG